MTLDEAIKHCKEKAREIRQAQEELPPEAKLSKSLLECACEHEQLAKWLEDYKRLLEERPHGDVNNAIKTIKAVCEDNNICTTCPMNGNCNEQPAKWEEVQE